MSFHLPMQDDAPGDLLDCLRSTSLRRISILGDVGEALLPILRGLAANTSTVDRTVKCLSSFPSVPPCECRQIIMGLTAATDFKDSIICRY